MNQVFRRFRRELSPQILFSNTHTLNSPKYTPPMKEICSTMDYYWDMDNTNWLPFKIDSTSELSSWRANTFYSKEPETLEWLSFFALKDEGIILLDVGANIGLYSLYFLSLTPYTEVICCEPFSENFDLLSKNIQLNGFSKRSTLIRNPLSSLNERGYAEIRDLRPGGSGYRYVGQQAPMTSSFQIETLTIDTTLAGENRRVIVKIDTDGSDFEILKGAKKSLESGKIVSVLIESDTVGQEKITKFLDGFGLLPNEDLNGLINHSDVRRIAAGKNERNRIYTKSSECIRNLQS